MKTTKTITRDSMAIQGTGIDIVEIQRLARPVQRFGKRFLNRLFTQGELLYCLSFADPLPHLAARFAAKEAAAKALGMGFGKELSWRDVEVVREPSGKPALALSPKAKKRFQNPTLHLSLTHGRGHAVAVAIWETL